jgi:hypothetical protein
LRIKAEQEAGRLATKGRPNKYDNDVILNEVKTLNDYGLTAKESSRAQELADHLKRSYEALRLSRYDTAGRASWLATRVN